MVVMPEEVYLQINLESQQEEDSLRTIDVFGVPSERSKSGEYEVSEQIYGFFELFVAKELFKTNRTLSQYSFESVKIWLYDTRESREAQGYTVPSADLETIRISSEVKDSELKYISVLDAGLTETQRPTWETGCKELLTPLFQRFISPEEPPAILHEFLQMRLGVKLANKLDLYFNMRKNMCFDALIVQAK